MQPRSPHPAPDAVRSSRRAFLRFLAGSPLLSLLGLPACRPSTDGGTGRAGDLDAVLSSPDDAINVFDFEAVAAQRIPPAHFGYLATGVDDDATVRANREGFARYRLRPRRLVDVSRVDASVELFGERWETPIVLCPVGSQRAFHPEGEEAVARAARAKQHLQILSTVTTTGVEDVIAARGAPVWYQLYPTTNWRITERLVRRAEAAGCPVLVLTVDLPVASNRETERRYARRDPRDCAQCHDPSAGGYFRRKRMFDGLDLSGVETRIGGLFNPAQTWDVVGRLRDSSSMKLVIKGIVTREDAERCARYGVDGIIVSNHGGRAEESGRATILSLPEVVDAVRGRMPVLLDGGVRRGNDILKALALGAAAVGIGRPYLWGLGAFGQAGVEKVLEILRAELRVAMQLAGAANAATLDRSFVTLD